MIINNIRNGVNWPVADGVPVRCSRLRVGLGTFIAFDVEGCTDKHAAALIDVAATAIMRVDSRMHPTQPDSDLSNIRAARVGEPVRVDPWTAKVLALAKSVYRASGGVFDPCLPQASGHLDDVELRGCDQVVAHAPVWIDLGGIAKGFAVDCAVEAIMAAGGVGACVNAGGDLRVIGARSYPVACVGPDGSDLRLELRDGALASSQSGGPDRPPQHRGFYNRVEVDAGAPPSSEGAPRAVTIAAGSAALADALTKCALLCAPERLTDLLRHFGAERISYYTR